MEAGSQITRVTRAQSYIPVENPTQNPAQRQRKIKRSKLPQRAAKNRKTEWKPIDRRELSRFRPTKQE